jgi:hypothetical protein
MTVIDQNDALTHFVELCEKPRMLFHAPRYDSVCAYILGYDTATGGLALEGFHGWLLVRGPSYGNVPWWDVIRLRAHPESTVDAELDVKQNRLLIQRLCAELRSFAIEVETRGRATIDRGG